MKKYILSLIAAAFFIISSKAQVTVKQPMPDSLSKSDKKWKGSTEKMTKTKMPLKDNYYYFKKGMLLQNSSAGSKTITKTVNLNDGITITPKGLVKMENGNTLQLKDGNWIDMNGNVTIGKPSVPLSK